MHACVHVCVNVRVMMFFSIIHENTVFVCARSCTSHVCKNISQICHSFPHTIQISPLEIIFRATRESRTLQNLTDLLTTVAEVVDRPHVGELDDSTSIGRHTHDTTYYINQTTHNTIYAGTKCGWKKDASGLYARVPQTVLTQQVYAPGDTINYSIFRFYPSPCPPPSLDPQH